MELKEKHCKDCWIDKIEEGRFNNEVFVEEYIPISEPFCCNDSCPCHNSFIV